MRKAIEDKSYYEKIPLSPYELVRDAKERMTKMILDMPKKSEKKVIETHFEQFRQFLAVN